MYLAEIRIFAGTYAPKGWHYCDGTLMGISGNEALFSLFGTSFGGDGRTNFALPDMRGRLPIGAGQGVSLTRRIFGNKIGIETNTLRLEESPSHSHDLMATKTTASSSSPVDNLYADVSPDILYSPTARDGSVPQVLNQDTLTSQGGGKAHENLMPALALNYIIAITGNYPSFQ
ncbi:MAG: tail fiber protein [Gallionellaceae bacterium]